MTNDKIDMILENEVKNVREFIFGGNSEFTVLNLSSGKGCRYKVRVAKNNKDMFFVRVQEGNTYVYAGYIKRGKDDMYYNRGDKGTKEIDDVSIKGLCWAIRHGDKELPKPIVMLHHGKCACCGRKLDDEISVARGFGPVCWERLQKKVEG